MAASLEGRVCIVTGPTSGIGKQTALELARLGAHLVLACRNPAKGEAVRAEVAAHTGNTQTEVMRIDLSEPESIRAFAEAFQSSHNRLDVLINNAGTLSFRRRLTSAGIEIMFAVNVLGPFLLTELLVPLLKSSAPSRVIHVGSATHYRGRVDFDNLQGERRFGFLRAYSNSKLEILLLGYEQARRLQGSGVTVNCVHPGAIRTGLYNGLPAGFRFVKIFLHRPAVGAAPIVRLAASAELQGVSGRYFDRLQEARSSAWSYDVSAGQRLWTVCEGLAGATT